MLRLFESAEERAKRERMEWVMAQKPDEKYRAPLMSDRFQFPVEKQFDFSVQQNGQAIRLHTYTYPAVTATATADAPPRAVCVIFHGLNSHVGRSSHIAHALAQIGITVVGFDHRGFGKSEGVRGYLESPEQHIGDCIAFIEIIERHFPRVPLYLCGLSMGGQTCFQLAVRDPQRYAGIVLHAPAIKDMDANQPIGKMIVKIVGAIAPTMPTVLPEGGKASKNPYTDESYLKDPYAYTGKMIPGTIRNLLVMSERCHAQYERLTTPFQIVIGAIDKLVDPDLAHELVRRSPAQDKEIHYYEKMWHNVWCEPEIEDVLAKMLQWFEKRLPPVKGN